MKFAEIRDRIVNNPGFRTLAEVREAGYRVVRERDGDRYFLARPEDLAPLLVRLGDIAEVRRGFTTGANDFFYLEPVGRTVAEVAELARQDPRAPVRIRNGAGWEGEIEAGWLHPVLKSPREIRTLRVRLEDLHYLVFMPPEEVRARMARAVGRSPLRGYPLARAYIRWGESRGYHHRPTCAGRPRWWVISEEIGNTFLGKELRDRIGIFVSEVPILADCRLYVTQVSKEVQSVINCTLVTLMDEVNARQYGGGGGPRSVMVYEATSLPVLCTCVPPFPYSSRFVSAIDCLAEREVRSIFEELGFSLCRERRCPHPEHPYEYVDPAAFDRPGSLAQVLPDRRALDEVVFEILGLTEEEQRQVYKAVAQLVKERLVKARSV